MKRKLVPFLCLILTAMAALTFLQGCAGCGARVTGFHLYTDKDNNACLVGDSIFISASLSYSNGSTKDVTSDTKSKITSDSTDGASLKKTSSGIRLAANSSGSVTVNVTYNDFSESITVSFVTREEALRSFSIALNVSSEDLRTGDGVPLSITGNNSLIEINPAFVQYTLTDNTADAYLDGTTLYAKKPGSVTVNAKYSIDGKEFTASHSYTFQGIGIILENPMQSAKVGDSIQIIYTMDPQRLDNGSFEHMSCEIINGNGNVKSENGAFYISSDAEGEVEFKLIYKNQEYECTCTGKINFSKRGFQIALPEGPIYVGQPLSLLASSEDIGGFNASQVVFKVLEGNASFENNVLTINDINPVRVCATYTYNETVVTSNELSILATYDGNTITTAQQLLELANSDVTVNLGADIDLSSYENWEPIVGFKGTLRGHGHTIRGLKLQVSNLEAVKGLFADLAGTVENLNIEGEITANGEASYIGLLCGKNTGTIKNVTVSGSIKGEYSDYVGGIAGWSDTSYVTGCTSSVAVWGRDYVGGIVGCMNATRSSAAEIKDNTNSGAIIGRSYVGGLYGALQVKGNANNEDTILVTNQTNAGTVTADGDYVGGLIGYCKGEGHDYNWSYHISYLRITNCKNGAEVTGKDKVGGLVGNAESNVSEISFSSNTGNVSGNLYVGGYAGYASSTTMRELKNEQKMTGKAWLGGIAGYCGKAENCSNNGTLEIAGYQLGDNNQRLSYVGGIAGFATSAVKCENNQDITVSDGGKYVGGIAGYLSAERLSSSEFKDNTNNAPIVGNDDVGGIFGAFCVQGNRDNEDTILIDGNTNNAEITGSGNNVGGIIGYCKGEGHNYNYAYHVSYVKITNCTNNAEITGVDKVGGIVGNAESNVSEVALCSNIGDIYGNLYVGGYAGYANSTTMRTLTNGQKITGKAWLGGIAGYCGKLDNCTNNGVLANQGNYLDENKNKLSYIGGIAGFATSAVKCKNNQDITVKSGGDYVGGIAGYLSATRLSSAEFKDNINNGQISGNNYVGGIFGAFCVQGNRDNEDSINVENNTNEGIINGNDYVGGIIGYGKGEGHNYNYGYHVSYVKITSCTNTAVIKGNDYVGGTLGNGIQYVSEIAFGKNEGDVSGNLYVGSYLGHGDGTTVSNLENGSTVSGKAWVGGIAGYCGKMESCTNNGDIRITGYHLDDEYNALSYVGGISGYATSASNCTNTANISVKNAGKYVGGITGYLHAYRSNDTALFKGNKNQGDISGKDYVGGIFGAFCVRGDRNNEDVITIDSNTNEGIINGNDYVGGIIGYGEGEGHDYNYGYHVAYVKITGCTNTATIEGNDYVGGILGNGTRYISEISFGANEGNISGNLYVGGYLGYGNETTVSNLENSNTISGKAWVGGVAGYCGKMESCANNGNILISGHYLDEKYVALSYVGGIAGYATSAQNCTNTTNISVKNAGNYVGGIAGYLHAYRSNDIALFKGNKNQGNISGKDYVGGIFGAFCVRGDRNNEDVITVDSNVNEGIVNGNQYVGGIFGYGEGEGHNYNYGYHVSRIKILHCTNTATIEGNNYVGGILGQGAKYMITDQVVWETNTVSGNISATGEHKGEYYGAIA